MNGRSRLRSRIVGCGTVIVAGCIAPSARVVAQSQPATAEQPHPAKFDAEVRLDAILARVSAVHVGAGVTLPMGYYVRSGIVGGLGASRHGLSGRVDGFARFHFDPFRESRWGPYGGGGISGRFDKGEGARAFLLLLAGIDGPVHGGVTSSVELGLGGGARVGVIIRQARRERR
jgi:hypothetical protein